MNIIKYKLMSEEELLTRLKQVKLKGFDRPFIYQNADLRIITTSVSTLTPPQRYVLSGGVETIIKLSEFFNREGINIFALHGAIMFWVEGMNPETDPPIPFLPPIVEDSIEKDGRMVRLINDGMHRAYAARKLGRTINVVWARNVPKEYPYYAYAFREGWGEVQVFDELPDVFQKKDYRNPENYKALFRQFNEVFPGVQEQRKQSNPDHIKM